VGEILTKDKNQILANYLGQIIYKRFNIMQINGEAVDTLKV